MEINDIPQDNSKSYQGHQKVIYATRNGNYETATSTGWDDEAYATEQAVDELNQLTAEAYAQVKRSEKSPIFYYMYAYRFDLISLSQATGLWQWQIRRHFKPSRFAKLSEKTLAKYAEAFQLSIAQLQSLPEKNSEK